MTVMSCTKTVSLQTHPWFIISALDSVTSSPSMAYSQTGCGHFKMGIYKAISCLSTAWVVLLFPWRNRCGLFPPKKQSSKLCRNIWLWLCLLECSAMLCASHSGTSTWGISVLQEHHVRVLKANSELWSHVMKLPAYMVTITYDVKSDHTQVHRRRTRSKTHSKVWCKMFTFMEFSRDLLSRFTMTSVPSIFKMSDFKRLGRARILPPPFILSERVTPGLFH